MTAKKDQTTKAGETKVEEVAGVTEPEVMRHVVDAEPVIKRPVTKEYVVTAGAAIAPLGNHKKARLEHGERARMYKSGEVVELTNKEARYYIGLKRLDPYVPEGDD